MPASTTEYRSLSAFMFLHFNRNIVIVQGDTKKRELLKPPTKIEEIQEKHFIDRN